MLLLHPPIAKPSEPPSGIAQLAGALLANGHPCTVVDLNLEGLLYLLDQGGTKQDPWSKRALKNKESNLAAIRSPSLYANFPRYQKCVLELNRLLEIQGDATITAGLANYQDNALSPLRSRDLLRIAQTPERSLFYPFFSAGMEELLGNLSSPYVGISINYLSQALNSFALIGFLKKSAPQLKIIVGGGLITSWMRGPNWNNPFSGLIDYCIAGRGEEPLLDILKTDGIRRTALPRYDLFPRTEYLSPGVILPFSSSSGCFWNKCSFCPEQAEGNRFRTKSPAQAVTEITALRQETTPALLHFLDNAIPPALLATFSPTMPALPWYGFVRITHHLLDLDFCKNLKKSGCVMLKLGLESGDQGVLDRMEKGLDIQLISHVLKNLKASGIATYVYLLFGTPSESYKEARKTLEFTVRHHEEIGFLNLAIFNMPINSSERDTLKTTTFYDGDLSLYTDFHHPLGWNRREVRLFLDREFKKKQEIAAILQRDPPLLTSNHAPFFCA
jgi:hypothetical protein